MKLSIEQIEQIERLATLHLALCDKGLSQNQHNEYEYLISEIDYLPLES